MSHRPERAVWVPVHLTHDEYRKIEEIRDSLGDLPLLNPIGEREGQILMDPDSVRLDVPFPLDEYILLEQRLEALEAHGDPISAGELVRRIIVSMLEKYTVEELVDKEIERVEAATDEINRLKGLWDE